ncbi:MAG: ABC transporter permease [Verrucomicrobiae bacterium]|nr:ABC transporter permease [Verrucomicrobiae bacterium]MDW7979416.1 ABC transporter permease [Verrucomicrobiales bacterium]
MKRWLPPILFFAALAGAWEWLVRQGVWPRAIVPAPSEVVRYLVTAVADGTLLGATGVTLRRLVLGYLIGFGFGLPAGVLIARFRFFRHTLGLLALGLQSLPSICWAPLALLWFGQTETAMAFIVVMGCVWSITLATDAGVRHVPPIYRWAAMTMGSRGLHLWVHVILPAALPFILSGMKQGWAFAWRSLMAAEIYVAILTGFGLGHLLHYGRELHAMDAVLGIMLVIILVGLATDKLLFAPLERFIHMRWGTERA